MDWRNLKACPKGATREKIKENVIPLVLIAVSFYIAYLISLGIKNILIYEFSLKPSPILGSPSYFMRRGLKIFQFELLRPFTIFLVLTAFLPNFEKHSLKMRIAGIITILFIHFGNFMNLFGPGEESSVLMFLILLFVYSAPLAAFFFKDWPTISMIALGTIYSFISLTLIYLDPQGPNTFEIRWLVSGLLVTLLGAIKARNVQGIKKNFLVLFFIQLGMMWTLAVSSFYLFYGMVIISQIFDFSLSFY